MDHSNITNVSNISISTFEKTYTFSELFQAENLRHSWPWIMFFTVLYTIIFVVGIVGNFLVILVYMKNSQMRSVRNLFIMNLAVADLFVILFCIPGNLVANTFIPWILGTFMCKGLSYIQGVSVFASAYFLAAISADRCIAFYRPMQIAQGFSKYQAIVTITVIWAAALSLLVPWAVVFEVTPAYENDPTLFCIETWEDEKHGDHYFLFGNFLSCYVIPVALICVCNFHLLCIVQRREVEIDSASSSIAVQSVHKKQNTNVTKTLFLLTFTFILSWLPLYGIACRMKFFNADSISESEHQVLIVSIPFVQLLGCSNSCINPVFYAFLNSKFRGMLQSVFRTNCVFSCYLRPECLQNGRKYQSKSRTGGGSSLKNSAKNRNTGTTLILRDELSQSSSLISIRQVGNCGEEGFKIKYERCRLKRDVTLVHTYIEICEYEDRSTIARETMV